MKLFTGLRLLRFLPQRWWSVRAWRTWAGYVRWRLATYGVFYPDGKIHWKALRALTLQMPSYFRWLSEIDKLRNKIPSRY